MARLFHDPSSFATSSFTGFCELHSGSVRKVEGGVVRAVPGPQGKVAVVIGGGAGHYPAFHGLVGPGFADGAAVGDLFVSPSAQEIYSVAHHAQRGGGVLFTFGNYSGDTMNFGLAQDRLRAEGVDCRTVVVTDDVASAPPHQRAARRGIAGGFGVYKMASAAAEEGLDLDEVERVAVRANERTRTLAVGFDGCTEPGQEHRAFTVPAGKMAWGLGVHGEPGVSDAELLAAGQLSTVLVDRLLAEPPGSGQDRVAVLLNGLGGTEQEELFALWPCVADLLHGAGLRIVEAETGEFVTSLDVAGISLTVVWLDHELERFWRASADTPAYCKHALSRSGDVRQVPAASPDAGPRAYPEATPESRAAAAALAEVFAEVRRALEDHAEELGSMDAVAGDADHGRGMAKGITAAHESAVVAAQAGAGVRSTLAEAADAWAARASGISGVLWGTGLRAFAGVLADDREPDAADLASGVSAYAEAIVRTGGAQVGDKTMVDAIAPFAAEFRSSWSWTRAANAARRAADATASLAPKLGRARPLAERSVGSPDPGAISFALVAEVVAVAVEGPAG